MNLPIHSWCCVCWQAELLSYVPCHSHASLFADPCFGMQSSSNRGCIKQATMPLKPSLSRPSCPRLQTKHAFYVEQDLALLFVDSVYLRQSVLQSLLVLLGRYEAQCLLCLVGDKEAKRGVRHDTAADDETGPGRESAV